MTWAVRTAVLAAAALTLTLPTAASVGAAPPTRGNGVQYKVLVFTKSAGGSHASTQAGVNALRTISIDERFALEVTDDDRKFDDSHLRQFRTVVFLNTSGDVLTDDEQAAFERYYGNGGGLVAIHAAIEAEPDWQFLTGVLGTRASGETTVQSGTIKVADRFHDASKSLPEYWTRTDGWYNFQANVRGVSHVLATLTEAPFDQQPADLVGITGGTMGPDHPIAWCKDYNGGRSFYTAGGHTPSSFSEPAFRTHLAGAIEWAAGQSDTTYSDCGATVLANYQQTKITAPPNLNEPIGFDVLPDGRVIQTARGGQVRLHDPGSGDETVLANIPVYTNSEDGLYGPAIDNGFEQNHWVYLYYAPPTVTVKQSDGVTRTITTPAGSAPNTAASLSAWDPWIGYFQLSRFKFVDGTADTPAHLDLATEQQILRVSNNRGACCHVAGDIDFDKHNNLWLVTGDDSPAGGGNSGGFGPFNDMKTNESQTVAVPAGASGTFTLTFQGQTTAAIAVPISNTDLEAKLEALENIDDVAVTGTGTRTVNFRGSLSATNVPQLTATATGVTVTIATTQEGDWFNAPHVDSRRSALNTNDLRGKVLRINVGSDGSYTIPPGNLFGPLTPKTRPEIYAMGFRNPFRIQVDENDVAYVTDYSPDSQVPEQFRGPAGTGRVEIVRKPANYGWPVCYSPTLPYYQWNFNTSTPLNSPPQPFACGGTAKGPDNTSRWNLNGGPAVEGGLQTTPPVTQPDIWYSYRDNGAPPLGTPCFAYYNGSGATACPQLFPEISGTNGVGPHGATKYHFDPVNPDATKFPPYYDGAVFLGEFTRDYLREVRLDSQNRVMKINDLLSCGQAIVARTQPFECDNPMDLQFDGSGHFYLLTYGDGFFAANPDAGLYRWDYVKGLRAPQAVIGATPTNGQEPLTVQFTSEGSFDPDPADSIRFAWDFDGDGTTDSVDPDPIHVYTTTGVFTAKLTVTDSSGKTDSKSTVITVGNTAPTVKITVPVEGGTFAFGDSIPFSVTVTDPEDGVIDCTRVHVTFVLGHDTHGHAEEDVTGCTAILHTVADDSSHGGNVFGVVSATYTDRGDGSVPALTTTEQVQIRQQKQEVEFVLEQSGTNTSSTADVGGGLQRGSLGNGDWLLLNGPFNLIAVDSLTFRVSGGTAATGVAGAVELHLDAVDGPLHSTFNVAATASATTYASQTFPLTDPGGLHKLYLVFRSLTGGPTNNFFNLNWVEFGGQGISAP